MNEFIKKQQELAREKYRDSADEKTLGQLLDEVAIQIITNTGEELLRLAEGADEYVLKDTVDDQMVYDSMSQSQKKCLHKNVKKGVEKTIDTLKKHITSVTGVE